MTSLAMTLFEITLLDIKLLEILHKHFFFKILSLQKCLTSNFLNCNHIACNNLTCKWLTLILKLTQVFGVAVGCFSGDLQSHTESNKAKCYLWICQSVNPLRGLWTAHAVKNKIKQK